MKPNFENNNQNTEADFLESLLNVAKDIAGKTPVPSPHFNDRSRTINNIRINVVVESDHRPGLLRRLLAKIF